MNNGTWEVRWNNGRDVRQFRWGCDAFDFACLLRNMSYGQDATVYHNGEPY